jgi:hypothetical protein
VAAFDDITLYHLARILEVPGGQVLVSQSFYAEIVARLDFSPPNVAISSRLKGRVAVRVLADGEFIVIALDAAGELSARPLLTGSESPSHYLPT